MKNLKVYLFLTLVSLIFAPSAAAYIDPGTGSYLFQIIAASILTVLFTFKNIFKFLRNMIKKLFSKKATPDE